MKIRLLHKLFLANLCVLLLVLVAVLAINYANYRWMGSLLEQRGFQQEHALIDNLALNLASEYAKNLDWQFIGDNGQSLQQWMEPRINSQLSNYPALLAFWSERGPEPADQMGHNRPMPPNMPPPELPEKFNNKPRVEHVQGPERNHKPELFFGGANFIAARLRLVDVNGQAIYPALIDADVQFRSDIKLHQQPIGYLELVRLGPHLGLASFEPLNRQFKNITLITLLAVILSLIASFLLARHITAPIQQLTQGATLLANRQFDMQLEINSGDELAELGVHFNSLGQKLCRYESQQKQWLQDIAHDLRTPLSILQCQVEAMVDGVLPADDENLGLLKTDILRLSRLIQDLNELSTTEALELNANSELIHLDKLLTQLAKTMQTRLAQRNISLMINAKPAVTRGDKHRLEQVVLNILENCYRYTEQNGQIWLSVLPHAELVEIRIEDSGPGVAGGKIEQLFDRLYRTDNVRNPTHGGAGLGLAICKNIIVAHGGAIEALPSQHGGLAIIIQLPRLLAANKELSS